MVVDNLTKIYEHVLLDLYLGVLVNLDPGCVDNAQVSHVVLAIFANDHELRLPELLVVRDLVVVRVTFTDLENALTTFKGDSKTLNLLCVNSFEL
jgi:hypothetical protein